MSISHFKSSDSFSMNTFNNKLDEISGAFAPPSAVGDLLFTTRDDVGDEWLECNHIKISSDYPALQEMFPITYINAAEVTTIDATLANNLQYYNGKYWSCVPYFKLESGSSEYYNGVGVRIYSTDNIFNAFEKKLDITYTFPASSKSPDENHVIYSSGKYYVCNCGRSGANFPQNVYGAPNITIDLNNLSSAQWQVVTGSNYYIAAMAYNEITGKFVYGGYKKPTDSDSMYAAFLYEHDNFYTPYNTTFNNAYQILNCNYVATDRVFNFKSIQYYNGLIFGRYTLNMNAYSGGAQRGDYVFAAPANDLSKAINATSASQNSVDNSAAYYYSKSKQKVVMWFSSSNAVCKEFNGTDAWTEISSGTNIPAGKMSGIYEVNNKYIILAYEYQNYVYNNVFDPNTTSNHANISSTGTTVDTPSMSLLDAPDFIEQNSFVFSNITPVVTLDNTNVYIRGK